MQKIALKSKVLDFVQLTSVFAKKALDEVQQSRSEHNKAVEKVAEVVELMQETKTIQPKQAKEAQDLLRSHTGTMDLLKNAVERIDELSKQVTKQASELGRPEDDPSSKENTFDSLNSPWVGRRTSEKKASDRAFERILEEPSI